MAALQEKQDEIDQLKDQLEAERAKLHEAQKTLADLKDEMTNLEGKLTAVTQEKDTVMIKQRDFMYKLQQAVEASQDKDDKIE